MKTTLNLVETIAKVKHKKKWRLEAVKDSFYGDNNHGTRVLGAYQAIESLKGEVSKNKPGDPLLPLCQTIQDYIFPLTKPAFLDLVTYAYDNAFQINISETVNRFNSKDIVEVYNLLYELQIAALELEGPAKQERIYQLLKLVDSLLHYLFIPATKEKDKALEWKEFISELWLIHRLPLLNRWRTLESEKAKTAYYQLVTAAPSDISSIQNSFSYFQTLLNLYEEREKLLQTWAALKSEMAKNAYKNFETSPIPSDLTDFAELNSKATQLLRRLERRERLLIRLKKIPSPSAEIAAQRLEQLDIDALEYDDVFAEINAELSASERWEPTRQNLESRWNILNNLATYEQTEVFENNIYNYRDADKAKAKIEAVLEELQVFKQLDQEKRKFWQSIQTQLTLEWKLLSSWAIEEKDEKYTFNFNIQNYATPEESEKNIKNLLQTLRDRQTEDIKKHRTQKVELTVETQKLSAKATDVESSRQKALDNKQDGAAVVLLTPLPKAKKYLGEAEFVLNQQPQTKQDFEGSMKKMISLTSSIKQSFSELESATLKAEFLAEYKNLGDLCQKLDNKVKAGKKELEKLSQKWIKNQFIQMKLGSLNKDVKLAETCLKTATALLTSKKNALTKSKKLEEDISQIKTAKDQVSQHLKTLEESFLPAYEEEKNPKFIQVELAVSKSTSQPPLSDFPESLNGILKSFILLQYEAKNRNLKYGRDYFDKTKAKKEATTNFQIQIENAMELLTQNEIKRVDSKTQTVYIVLEQTVVECQIADIKRRLSDYLNGFKETTTLPKFSLFSCLGGSATTNEKSYLLRCQEEINSIRV